MKGQKKYIKILNSLHTYIEEQKKLLDLESKKLLEENKSQVYKSLSEKDQDETQNKILPIRKYFRTWLVTRFKSLKTIQGFAKIINFFKRKKTSCKD